MKCVFQTSFKLRRFASGCFLTENSKPAKITLQSAELRLSLTTAEISNFVQKLCYLFHLKYKLNMIQCENKSHLLVVKAKNCMLLEVWGIFIRSSLIKKAKMHRNYWTKIINSDYSGWRISVQSDSADDRSVIFAGVLFSAKFCWWINSFQTKRQKYNLKDTEFPRNLYNLPIFGQKYNTSVYFSRTLLSKSQF